MYFMESESLLPCSQGTTSGAYSESDESNPDPHILRCILILPYHIHVALRRGVSLSCVSTENLNAFIICPMRASCPTHLFPLDSLILTRKNNNYEALFFLRFYVASNPVGPKIYSINLPEKP